MYVTLQSQLNIIIKSALTSTVFIHRFKYIKNVRRHSDKFGLPYQPLTRNENKGAKVKIRGK